MRSPYFLLVVLACSSFLAKSLQAQGWPAGGDSDLKTQVKKEVQAGESEGAPVTAPIGQEHSDEIKKLVAAKFQKDGPGVAILVSRHGVPLYVGCYGLADVKTQRPITPDTLFDLASCSKHITAMAVLTLVEQGKLSLQNPVADYLKDFAVPVKGRPVTVSDLLHHTSGLADYTGDEWDGTDAEFAALTPETHLQWLNTTQPRRAPGLKYVYNNTEYVLLSLLVSQTSGQSYSDYVRKHLFQPAGMTETEILDGRKALPAITVKGYMVNEGGKVSRSFSPTVITGDGSIYTSLHDLVRWDEALRRHVLVKRDTQELAWANGRYDSGKPISEENGAGYGFGWVIEADGANVWHNGSWDGTATYLRMNRQTGLTVAILSNDENADVVSLGEKIAALFD